MFHFYFSRCINDHPGTNARLLNQKKMLEKKRKQSLGRREEALSNAQELLGRVIADSSGVQCLCSTAFSKFIC